MYHLCVNLKDLQRYRQELVSDHESELAAIDRLIARERMKLPVHNMNGNQVANTTTRSVSHGLPSVAPAVKSALDKIGNGNFTKDQVVGLLNQMGVSMEDWGPRAVGINLWRRARAGELAVVRKGGGGAEAVYKKA
jgi:hypothetical protein